MGQPLECDWRHLSFEDKKTLIALLPVVKKGARCSPRESKPTIIVAKYIWYLYIVRENKTCVNMCKHAYMCVCVCVCSNIVDSDFGMLVFF